MERATLYLGPLVRCSRTRQWNSELVCHFYAAPGNAGALIAVAESLNLPTGQYHARPVPRYELYPHQRLRVARSSGVVEMPLAHELQLVDRHPRREVVVDRG